VGTRAHYRHEDFLSHVVTTKNRIMAHQAKTIIARIWAIRLVLMANDVQAAAKSDIRIPIQQPPQAPPLPRLPILLAFQQRMDLGITHGSDAGAGGLDHRMHDDALREGEGHGT
jgi:hypothetical protein